MVDDIVYPYRTYKTEYFFESSFTPDAKTLAPIIDEWNQVFPSVFNRYKEKQNFFQVRKEPTSHVSRIYWQKKASNTGRLKDTITQIIPRFCDIERITLRTNPDRIIHNAKIEIFTNYQHDEAKSRRK